MDRDIIQEYKKLTSDIAVIESCLTSVNRDINKCIRVYKPSDAKTVDYQMPVVQTSSSQPNIVNIYIQLHDLETEKQSLESELESLYKQRNDLEQVIESLGDIAYKALMLRAKGYPNWRVAKTLNYSQRGIEAVFKRAIKKYKECGENVV